MRERYLFWLLLPFWEKAEHTIMTIQTVSADMLEVTVRLILQHLLRQSCIYLGAGDPCYPDALQLFGLSFHLASGQFSNSYCSCHIVHKFPDRKEAYWTNYHWSVCSVVMSQELFVLQASCFLNSADKEVHIFEFNFRWVRVYNMLAFISRNLCRPIY